MVVAHIDIWYSHLLSYGIHVSLTLHSLCSSYDHDSYNISCLSYVPLEFSPFMVSLLLTVFHYSISFSAILSLIWWLILSSTQWSHFPLHHICLCHMWHHVHLSDYLTSHRLPPIHISSLIHYMVLYQLACVQLQLPTLLGMHYFPVVTVSMCCLAFCCIVAVWSVVEHLRCNDLQFVKHPSVALPSWNGRRRSSPGRCTLRPGVAAPVALLPPALMWLPPLALPRPAWPTWWPLCLGRSWRNFVVNVRPYLYQMNIPCTGTSLLLPRWRCPAMVHWKVTQWTVKLPAHLTPVPGRHR